MIRSFSRPVRICIVLCPIATVTALATSHATFAFVKHPKQIADITEVHETHFKNVKQLTFGGQNAEAYFSEDGKRLTFQSQRDGYPCDQQFVMDVDGSNVVRVSNGTSPLHPCASVLPLTHVQIGLRAPESRSATIRSLRINRL